jgi:hypothetical protein
LRVLGTIVVFFLSVAAYLSIGATAQAAASLSTLSTPLTNNHGTERGWSVGDQITFYATFQGDVQATYGSIVISVGGTEVQIPYVGKESSKELKFNYSVTAGTPNGEIKMVRWGSHDIRDMQNQAFVPFNGGDLSNYYYPGILAGEYIDTIAPRIVEINSSVNDFDPFTMEDSIQIQVKFSERITRVYPYGGNYLQLNNGAEADYIGGQGSDTLTFEYVVYSGDTTDLNVTGIKGIYKDIADHDSSLSLSGITPLSDKKNIRIDTSPPSVTFGSDPSSLMCSRNVKINASDSIAGVDYLYYKWDLAGASIDWNQVSNQTLNGGIVCVPQGGAYNGTYHLYVRAIDKVGNAGTSISGQYFVDGEPPAIVLLSEEGPARGKHNVKIHANDAGSNIISLKYYWTNTDTGIPTEEKSIPDGTTVSTPDGEGAYRLSVYAEDTYGNHSTRNSAGLYIVDKTPPSVQFTPEGNGTPAQTHTAAIMVTDAKGVVGPSFYAWSTRVDHPLDGSWSPPGGWQPVENGAVTTPPGETGVRYLYIRTTDNPDYPAESNVGYSVESNGFELDNTPPDSSFTVNGNGTYERSVTTGMNLPDDVSSIRYIVSEQSSTDGNDTLWDTSADGTIKIDNRSGIYYIHAKIYDYAGNTFILSSIAFHLDNQGPVGTVRAVMEHSNQSAIELAVEAEDVSGLKEMAFRINGAENDWTPWIAYASTAEVQIPVVEGEHTIAVKFKDNLDNESVAYYGRVVYDITAPTVSSIVYSETDWTNQPVTVTISLLDNLSSSDQIRIIGHDEPSYTFHNNGTYEFVFEDQAGNRSARSVSVGNIDKAAPSVTFTPNGSPLKRQSVSAQVTAADNHTGSENIRLLAQWTMDAGQEPAQWDEVKDKVMNGEFRTLADTDGAWYLWVKAVDLAGNATSVHSSSFQLDNTDPIGTITYSTTKRTAGTVTAYLAVDETVTVLQPENGSSQYTFSENGSFTFRFVDEAGNEGTAEAIVSNIDKSVPSATVTLEPSVWTNGTVTVRLGAPGPRELYGLSWTGEARVISLNEEAQLHEFVHGGTVTESVYGGITEAQLEFNSNGTMSYSIRDLDTGLEHEGDVVVSQIDRLAPRGTLAYSETGWTNRDVTVTLAYQDESSNVTIVNNGGSNAYVFQENGEFEFIFQDQAGNESRLKAVVDQIDKTAPNPVLTYSRTEWTRDDVLVTVSFDNESQPVTITNNGGSNQYRFTQNGEFTFDFRDVAGNAGQVTARVDYIDRVAPVGRINYSTRDWTNEAVTVVLEATDNSGAPVRILNNGGDPQYVFADNGEFIFLFEDAAGNRNEAKAVVSLIDSIAPVVSVQYSVTTPTNTAVRATVIADKPIIVKNNGQSRVYDFTDNGEFIFEVADLAGNMVQAKATVNQIDRTPPIPQLSYSTTSPTKDRVIVTVEANEEFVVLNNARRKQYIFEENGTFTFMIQDLAGNTAQIEASVSLIDKSKPKVSLEYSTKEPTRDPVEVTLVSDKPLTILNNGGSSKVIFNRNGTQWIHARDHLGNELTIRMDVDHIDLSAPQLEFRQGDPMLLKLGQTIAPLADVTATDNLDGNVTGKVTARHNILPTEPGEYEIIYEVEDRAGNRTVVTRKAIIKSEDRFAVYVNSLAPDADNTIVVYGSTIRVSWFGAHGGVTATWAEGKKGRGEMKLADALAADDVITVDKGGYYTLLVQDQERQAKLIHVFAIVR